MTPLEQLAAYAQVIGCEIVTLRQAIPSKGEPAMLTYHNPPQFKQQADQIRETLLGKQRERRA